MPTSSIMEIFAKSPIKPIEKHMSTVCEASKKLVPLFDAAFAGDWEGAEKIRYEISHLEKDADVLKREIRLNLPSGIFMPVERTDLLELIKQQDRIANTAKDIAGRMIGRELVVPTTLQEDFRIYVQRCVDAVVQSTEAINELDELLETSFRGRELEIVEKMISQLDLIEDDTDSLQIKMRRQLRDIEGELNPVDVMFLYHIIEKIGNVADEAERVGSRLELMLARS